MITVKRLRVRNNKITLVKRPLFGQGKILVSVGQQVSPTDIIGNFSKSRGYISIDLAKELGVSPDKASKYLSKKMGDRVFKDELLAYKGGSLLAPKKIILSSSDVVLESYDQNSGFLKMDILPKEVSVPAGCFGLIERVDQANQDVFIKTSVTEIFGILGSGGVKAGILKILGPRGSITDTSSITPDCSEHIVVGGGLIYNDTALAAKTIGVSGVIGGGINAEGFKIFSKEMGVALMVTEGYGPIAMGEDIFEVLNQYKNRFVILDGTNQKLVLPSFDPNVMLTVNKTSLPKILPQEEILEEVAVAPGLKARIIAPPFMGQQGKVINIDGLPSTLPSGVSSQMVAIETKSRKIKVPFENIEIIN